MQSIQGIWPIVDFADAQERIAISGEFEQRHAAS
jgi:hypothetical protein